MEHLITVVALLAIATVATGVILPLTSGARRRVDGHGRTAEGTSADAAAFDAVASDEVAATQLATSR